MDIAVLKGPIIGAMIGYGTNWIAIKMLFRPREPIKIGKFTLPFTPGIIPKRKEKLAKAIGQMVGDYLFTRKDLQEVLLTKKTEDEIIRSVLARFNREKTLKSVCLEIVNEKQYLQGREHLKLFVSEKIKNALLQAKVGTIIAEEGGQMIRKKVSGSMLKMVVTDGLIDSIVNPMGEKIERYIEEHGQERMNPIVEKEIGSLENCCVQDIMCDFEENQLEEGLRNLYRNFVLQYVPHLLEKLDISKIVEEKVNQMDVLALETLLLTVMKKELGAIVNLGALIGLILGTLNG